MNNEEMVIFSRLELLLDWLAQKTEHFPKRYRHTISQRLLDAAFDHAEWLYRAQAYHGRKRTDALHEADAALNRLRFYLRLAFRWRWLSQGQYEHVSRMVAEQGRLLGGWMRAENKR